MLIHNRPFGYSEDKAPCCNGKEKNNENKMRQIKDEHKYKSWSSEEEVIFSKCPEQRFVGGTFISHLLKAISQRGFFREYLEEYVAKGGSRVADRERASQNGPHTLVLTTVRG